MWQRWGKKCTQNYYGGSKKRGWQGARVCGGKDLTAKIHKLTSFQRRKVVSANSVYYGPASGCVAGWDHGYFAARHQRDSWLRTLSVASSEAPYTRNEWRAEPRTVLDVTTYGKPCSAKRLCIRNPTLLWSNHIKHSHTPFYGLDNGSAARNSSANEFSPVPCCAAEYFLLVFMFSFNLLVEASADGVCRGLTAYLVVVDVHPSIYVCMDRLASENAANIPTKWSPSALCTNAQAAK